MVQTWVAKSVVVSDALGRRDPRKVVSQKG